jgi:ATP-binding cassette subfamily F protein 3
VRSTPRGVVVAAPKPRESAQAAAARRRREAEERNARYRRTRDLRASLHRTDAEAIAAERELAEVSARLADPAVYADATLVRQLVERHNALRDRTEALAAERERAGIELSRAEDAELVRSE